MKKFAKRFLCFAVCLLLCLGALTSCTTLNKATKSPEALAEILEEAGCINVIVTDATEIKETAANLNIEPDNIEAIVMGVVNDDFNTTGFFFFCTSTETAKDTEEVLEKYREEELTSEIYTLTYIVRRSGNVVYIGAEVTWEVVAGESKGAAGVNPIIIAIIVISVVVIALIAIALLIVVVITVVFVVVTKKKKEKKLAAQKAQADTDPPVEKNSL